METEPDADAEIAVIACEMRESMPDAHPIAVIAAATQEYCRRHDL